MFIHLAAFGCIITVDIVWKVKLAPASKVVGYPLQDLVFQMEMYMYLVQLRPVPNVASRGHGKYLLYA